MGSDKNVVCVRLDLDDLVRLEKLARSKGLDRSKLLRQIIIQYLDKEILLGEQVDNEVIQRLSEIYEKTKINLDAIYNKWMLHIDTLVNEFLQHHPEHDRAELRNEKFKMYKHVIFRDLKSQVDKAIGEIKLMKIPSHIKTEYIKKLYYLLSQYPVNPYLYP